MHDDLGALIDAIVTYVRAGDQVVVMSNGGFGGIHAKLLAQLADSRWFRTGLLQDVLIPRRSAA